jgi:hypothetical protein
LTNKTRFIEVKQATVLLLVLAGLFLIASCRTDKASLSFWPDRLNRREVVEINQKLYKTYLNGGKDGTVGVWMETRRSDPKHLAILSTSIKTFQKTKITIADQTFDLLAGGSSSKYQTFHSISDDMANLHDLSGAFAKEIAIKIEIEGQSPLSATLYSPAPLQIVGPTSSDQFPPMLTAASEIKWVPDPRNHNGIVLEVKESTNPNTETGEWPNGLRYTLLTPDDGNLAIKDILPYLAKGNHYFMVTMYRYTQKTIKAGGKKYSILLSTSENAFYSLTL